MNALAAHAAILKIAEPILELDEQLGQTLGRFAVGTLEELGGIAQSLGPDAHLVQLCCWRVIVDASGALAQLSVGAPQTAWRILTERGMGLLVGRPIVLLMQARHELHKAR